MNKLLLILFSLFMFSCDGCSNGKNHVDCHYYNKSDCLANSACDWEESRTEVDADWPYDNRGNYIEGYCYPLEKIYSPEQW